MGASHARAYEKSPHFEVVGLVSRSPQSRDTLNRELMADYPVFSELAVALKKTEPTAACISTYPDTHSAYAIQAIKSGCHVFLEKPIATTVAQAQKLIRISKENNRKLVIGYILQHHPTWSKFVEEAKKLGKPLVMRMNLNQQSFGKEWNVHRNIMQSMSPIVDCGVHYVDVMCRMTESKPVRVQAIQARLSDQLPPERCNYGQLQVAFSDGSVGWYEAGWGPMMSQTAFFVKDVIGPLGSVSIAADPTTLSDSSNVNLHTNTDALHIHSAELNESGTFAQSDQVIRSTEEPGHDGLCEREQHFFAAAIQNDLDLSDHHDSALQSLKIVLAAERSARTGKAVRLNDK